MGSLSMVEAKLPPGFRFYPRDEELVGDYLLKKVARHEEPPLLIEVDLNKCEPWDIPETACVGGKEWYFYSQRDRKYATGLRTNRATASGYWKATGKDRPVIRQGTLVGMRKTLVFYQGRAPQGKKSDWIMHEFRLEGLTPKILSAKEDWVLCRMLFKSREAPPKQGMESSCDDTNSSFLPALMDPYMNFNQNQANMNEQVPCLSTSNYPKQHNTTTFSHMITHTEPNTSTRSLPIFEGMPDSCSYLNHSSYDKNVLKAVLDHLTKMDSNLNVKESSSFGEGSSESFFSEVGLPNMCDRQLLNPTFPTMELGQMFFP